VFVVHSESVSNTLFGIYPLCVCVCLCVFGVVLTGFLQIAMVFARTGQMDRAVDLTRRALYCYECAFIEVTAHPSSLSSFLLFFFSLFFSTLLMLSFLISSTFFSSSFSLISFFLHCYRHDLPNFS
jgi:hypothetical protein